MGEGSYGKVYYAINKLDDKPYAIKVLDKSHIIKVSLNNDVIIELKIWKFFKRKWYFKRIITSKYYRTLFYISRSK